MHPIDPRRAQLAKAQRIVIKVGTSTITHENGRFNLTNMENLCRSIANLMNQGKEVILVSSGAIGVGVGKLRLPEKPKLIRDKQAVAAVGQCELMNMYSRILNDYNHIVAQILLTKDDIDEPQSRTNVCNTFESLIEKQILPIVNENDTVSTREIYHNGTFGDNDTLSAMVAVLTKADLLIILSDIDGLYDSDPRSNAQAKLLDHIEQITDEVEQLAGGAGTNRGTGGMRSKIVAARISTVSGIDTLIANGSKAHTIDQILEQKAVGTLFAAYRD